MIARDKDEAFKFLCAYLINGQKEVESVALMCVGYMI